MANHSSLMMPDRRKGPDKVMSIGSANLSDTIHACGRCRPGQHRHYASVTVPVTVWLAIRCGARRTAEFVTGKTSLGRRCHGDGHGHGSLR